MSNEAPTDALRLVPVDTGPNFSDSSLPLNMIYAGAAAIERATDDMANYVSGETIDWDSGMMAVAVYRDMLAAAPASPLPGGGDILWMMHVRGPDDIYPAPDYETAVAWCDYVNDVLAKAVPEVMTKAVPAIWTGTPESHADGLPEAIKGWTLPAAPTGDAG